MARRVDVQRPSDDELIDAGDQLALAFDDAAEWAVRIRERLTWIRAQRTAGKSYSALAIEVGQPPVVLEATNSTLEALLTAGTRLRRLIARALYADGMTMDEIATALGVSRQRVSHLLSSDPDCIAPPWTRR